jgi:hypothetical protein
VDEVAVSALLEHPAVLGRSGRDEAVRERVGAEPTDGGERKREDPDQATAPHTRIIRRPQTIGSSPAAKSAVEPAV